MDQPDRRVEQLEEEVERLTALCRDLVGEETLHQDGQYETEMQRLRSVLTDLLAACKILDRVLTSGPQSITQAEIDQIQAAIEKAEPTT